MGAQGFLPPQPNTPSTFTLDALRRIKCVSSSGCRARLFSETSRGEQTWPFSTRSLSLSFPRYEFGMFWKN